jgi:hypothetical protein
MMALNTGEGWKGYFKGQDSDFKQEKDDATHAIDNEYAQEEEDDSFEYVQLDDKVTNTANDHANDTDDIPAGQDPVGLSQADHHHSVSLAESMLTQLDSGERGIQIPHENDTEDIIPNADEITQYNRHHSKLWNEVVNRKAQELEDEMQAQESLVKTKKKEKEQAKLRAAEEAHKRAEEQKRREQAAKEQKDHELRRTVDFSELYGSMVPDVKAVQTDA